MMKPRRLMPRRRTECRITAKVPTLPASVGVNQPFIRPPNDQDEHQQDPGQFGQGGQALPPARAGPLGPHGGVGGAPDQDGQGEETPIVTDAPCTVGAELSFTTSAAYTRPGMTW